MIAGRKHLVCVFICLFGNSRLFKALLSCKTTVTRLTCIQTGGFLLQGVWSTDTLDLDTSHYTLQRHFRLSSHVKEQYDLEIGGQAAKRFFINVIPANQLSVPTVFSARPKEICETSMRASGSARRKPSRRTGPYKIWSQFWTLKRGYYCMLYCFNLNF